MRWGFSGNYWSNMATKLKWQVQAQKYKSLVAKMILMGHPVCTCLDNKSDNYSLHWMVDGSYEHLANIHDARKMTGEKAK